MAQKQRSKRAVGGTTLLRMRERGVIALPPEMRENSLFAAVKRPDGVIELRPQRTVDAAQTWFWTERWQRMEREAEADIQSGRVRRFDDVDELFADLDAHARIHDSTGRTSRA